jgi:hypothetical protein
VQQKYVERESWFRVDLQSSPTFDAQLRREILIGRLDGSGKFAGITEMSLSLAEGLFAAHVLTFSDF